MISNCVIGRNCTIGAGVRLTNAYVWDNVTIGDDCCIDQAILADGVVIKQEVTIKPGSLLSFDVVVGPSITIEHNTRISLKACNDADGFDDSDSEGDSFDEEYDPEEVGTEGKGRIWTPEDDDDAALMLWGTSSAGGWAGIAWWRGTQCPLLLRQCYSTECWMLIVSDDALICPGFLLLVGAGPAVPGAGKVVTREEEEEVDSGGDSFGESDDDSAGSGSEDGGDFNTGDRKGTCRGGLSVRVLGCWHIHATVVGRKYAGTRPLADGYAAP